MSSSRSSTSAIVLAGGRATRMGGIAKHAIVVDGMTILDRLRAVLEPRCAELVVATNAPIAGVRCVPDAVVDGGPLAGIAAGLAAVRAPWAIVVAGDMPYVSAAVIDALVEAAAAGAEAAAFRIDGWPEPLCCALRVAAARPAVAAMLTAGEHKAARLLARLDVHWLAAQDRAAFRNLNSPDDLPPRSGI